MNENELFHGKDSKSDIPIITEIDFLIDTCFKDCPSNFFINLNKNA